jgi:hypothetical protein
MDRTDENIFKALQRRSMNYSNNFKKKVSDLTFEKLKKLEVKKRIFTTSAVFTVKFSPADPNILSNLLKIIQIL